MKTRALFALAALAGTAAVSMAQESISFKLGFIEVAEGTTTPVGVSDGQINPATESARIQVTFDLSPNPGGTAIWDTRGGTGQISTVGGLGSMLFDLVGSGGIGTKSTFGKVSRRAGFALGPAGATSATGVTGAGAGQFILPGQTPLADDNVIVYSINWDPGSDVGASGVFTYKATTQTALLDAGIRDPEENILWVNDDWSAVVSSVTIPIVPAPSTLALLGLGGLIAGRRRR